MPLVLVSSNVPIVANLELAVGNWSCPFSDVGIRMMKMITEKHGHCLGVVVHA
jgi:hypothetical protein